ncbi:MAG: FAD-binding oxidoreductase [Gemmatimonadetes bacterium]|jgi:glycolate oxidase|nr:FAD-binding oxidoreductase [Gemmatimonadota bacterium]
MQLPPPSQKRLQQREELVRRLRELLGDPDQVIHRPEDLVVYECDALSAYRQQPMAVILASSAEEVSRVVRLCGEIDIPIVPWGAGTGLSGGALPLSDGVVISLARMNRILDIDLENRAVTAEAGVTNLAITRAVEDRGFYYAPDPSSQLACTIGGNVAENSGGVHCLKYGTTTNNILGVQVVLADGEVVDLGGKSMDQGGYDLLALMTGSEGLLGIITEATVRILRKPESARAFMAVFDSVESTGRAVSDIIASGMVPSGMEIMDRLSIEAVEDFLGCGYPRGVEALLLVELDGVAAEVEARIGTLETLLRQAGATELRRADTEEERARLWSGRKAAFPAMGRVAPDYYCMDGTIPRGRLPEVLHLIQAMSKDFGLQVANVFHAGDGNLHPLILYDSNAPGELERAESFGAEILQLCVRVGGVLSGEHGIGVEKRDLMPCMFTDADLDSQERVKAAFDPRQLLNPGKVFPLLRRCIPGGSMHVHAGELPFPGLERF